MFDSHQSQCISGKSIISDTYHDKNEIIETINYLKKEASKIDWGIVKNNTNWSIIVPKKQEKEAKIIFKIYNEYGDVRIYYKKKNKSIEQKEFRKKQREYIREFKMLIMKYMIFYIQILNNEDKGLKDFYENILDMFNKSVKLPIKSEGTLLNISTDMDNEVFEDFNKFNEVYILSDLSDPNSIYQLNIYKIFDRVNNILIESLVIFSKNPVEAATIWKIVFDFGSPIGKELLNALMFLVEMSDLKKSYQLLLLEKTFLVEKSEEENEISNDDENLENIEEDEIDKEIEELVDIEEKVKQKQKKIDSELEFIRNKICFIKFKSKGVKFNAKKINLSHLINGLGEYDKNFKSGFEAKFKIFENSDVLNQASKQLQKRVKQLKKRFLLKINNYEELVLLRDRKEAWEEAKANFHNRELNKLMLYDNEIEKNININKDKIKDTFTNSFNNKIKSLKEEKEKELNRKLLTKSLNRIDSECEKILYNIYNLDFEYKVYDVSIETLKDKNFCIDLAANIYFKDKELADKLIDISEYNASDIENYAKSIIKENKIMKNYYLREMFSGNDILFNFMEDTNLTLISQNNEIIAVNSNCGYGAVYTKGSKKIDIITISYEVIDNGICENTFIEMDSCIVNEIKIHKNYIAVILDNNKIEVYDYLDNSLINSFDFDKKITSLNFAKHGTGIIVGGVNCSYVIDYINGDNSEEEYYECINDDCFDVVDFLQNDRYLILGGSQGEILLRDKHKKIIRLYDWSINGSVLDVSFDSKENELISVYSDEKFRVWDIENEKLLYESKEIKGLKKAICLENGGLLLIADTISIFYQQNDYKLINGISYFDNIKISEEEQCILLSIYNKIHKKCFLRLDYIE